MRLTFKWVESIKQIALLNWVGHIQSGEGLNKIKKADPPRSKREFLLFDFLGNGMWAFTSLQMQTKTSVFLGS